MTALLDHLRRRIALEGPLPVARYMEEALTHPRHGYYMGRDPLGRGGDFITSPEISQMFGEMIGLWCAVTWQSMGSPSQVRLAELGPGRGTLMSDLLRAAKGVPRFPEAVDIHLVEASPTLRERQKEILAGHAVTWHDTVADLPDGPLLLVANEFFDALPIHQFEHRTGAWHERLVDVDPESEDLRFVLGPPTPGLDLGEAADGAIRELSPVSEAIAAAIGDRLAAFGGAALVIDYGHLESGVGDTLQAMKGHAYHPVLDDPGEADLTAHVDFEALGRALSGTGARVREGLEQGTFLTGLGIEARAGALARKATPKQVSDIEAALHRLCAPDQMGRLFKVLCATHPDLPPPPPFT